MPIETLILKTIAEETFKYLLEISKDRAGDKVSNALFGNPKKKAFERALKTAVEQLETQHREWVDALFDASFLSHEGAPVLARFLMRDGRPDSSELAKLWADSLRLRGEQRTAYIRELEPVTADFFKSFAQALKAEPELNELHDGQALERIAASTEAIHRALGVEKATPGTRYDYLRWIIDRNLYLDPRGIAQTQRQVQLKLDEIYVSLRAQREDTPGTVDKRFLEKELAEIERQINTAGITAEEAEDQREQLLALHQKRSSGADSIGINEVLELHNVVSRHERLVILGDPGSGKTTLLRYLALMHAKALYDGHAEASSELGPTRFPLLVRIAAYAENGIWKGKSLSDFLPDYCAANECPKSGFADLLTTELDNGNCLILLDGLDEIVSADDRRGIVQKIESFIGRYNKSSNRFIVTSRIAGYNSAPMAEPSVHYTVQEMDPDQIQRFLNRWCPAVEVAQTPDVSPEIRAVNAQREIDGILKAVETSPGVRRLATNPLLLTVLALIHRTGARLPEKRIQLYKLAAETLARTWRAAQGVPESALLEDTYLTRLLSKMAYWLHVNKPTGIATENEVLNVLGEEWARIKRLTWNEDDPDPAIISEVKKFLMAVRVQTGLFVERAPRRYGFMHLTFEEYYVARYLVARIKTAAGLIRKHLHNPRWEEPILLALGFMGLDYPDQVSELIEAAILAQGQEAEDSNIEPSEYEDILGRDYLFALRCLGDQIPMDPQLVQVLIERLARELVHDAGSARFQRYRRLLERRLISLRGSEVASQIVPLLLGALHTADETARLRSINYLGSLDTSFPEVIEALQALLKDEDASVRYRAVQSLGQLGQTSPEGIDALRTLLKDEDVGVRYRAVESLIQLGQMSPEGMLALLKDEAASVRYQAMRSLGQLENASPEVIEAMLALFKDEDESVRYQAMRSLGQLGQTSPEVIDALRTLLKDEDEDVRYQAAESLIQLENTSPEGIEAMLALLKDEDVGVRYQAIRSLGQLENASPEVIEAMRALLKDEDASVRYQGVLSLIQLGQNLPELIEALLKDEDVGVRYQAATRLAELEQKLPEAIEALQALLKDEDASVRYRAVQSLGQLENTSPEVIEALRALLKDEDASVRYQAMRSLGQLGQTSSELIDALQALVKDENMEDSVRIPASLYLARLVGVTPQILDGAREGILKLEDWADRQSCASFLGQSGQADEPTLNVLFRGLLDEDNDVRKACVEALVKLGQRFSDSTESIVLRLLSAINDQELENVDRYAKRTGQDYAFDALWLLVVGEKDEESRAG